MEPAMGGDTGLQVLRCLSCGDTFPSEGPDHPVCPTCGGVETEPAREPLL